MKEEKNIIVKAIAALAIGTALGYLTGLLTAKKTGKELRHEIASESEKLAKKAKENLDRVYSQAGNEIERFTQEAKKKYSEIKSANKGKKFDLSNIAKQVNQIFNRTKTEV